MKKDRSYLATLIIGISILIGLFVFAFVVDLFTKGFNVFYLIAFIVLIIVDIILIVLELKRKKSLKDEGNKDN